MKGVDSSFLALSVYVDDMVIADPSFVLIQSLKDLLNTNFKLKDLGSLSYFLDLEIALSSKGIVLSQRQYTLQ